MNVIPTKIPGLLLFELKALRDERGYFLESFHKFRYQEAGVESEFMQDNLSISKKGVLRGLHYQTPPYAQGKLVTVLKGSVLDVAVDIRRNSSTFGQYEIVELSEKNKRQFWIPEGFAHGFISLEDDTLLSYKCTNVYSPEFERGIRWDDPDIQISWPNNIDLLVSEKDKNLPFLKDIERDF